MPTELRTAGDLKPGDEIQTPYSKDGYVQRVTPMYVGPTISYDADGEVIPISPDFTPRSFDSNWRLLHIEVVTEEGVYNIARFPHEAVT